MPRTLLALMVVCLLVGGTALAEDEETPLGGGEETFDIGGVANRIFGDLTLLPTRLTSYNTHDDAATASYTCCRPDQEVEIERALKANTDFVNLYPLSDFADDALFHSGRVNSVKKDMLNEVASWGAIARNYPDSDLWDDAVWNLATCFERDKDRPNQIRVLEELLIRRPDSMNADDACLALSRAYVEMRDEDGALHALVTLATKYRSSEYCDDALYQVARKYQELGSYEDAIAAYDDLVMTWPMSDYVDDAQFGIGQSLRAMHNLRDALPAYEVIIHEMPGSSFVRPAMAEVNTMQDGTYDLKGHFPCDDASDLWDLANHFQNYRQFDDAIRAYGDFIAQFPGHDNIDDAWFRIGNCYQLTDKLFKQINEAKGPEDLFRKAEEFKRATGGRTTIPAGEKLTAVGDATSAYAVVVNALIGSNLRDEALREIAKCYEINEMHDEAAWTYQEKIVNFPYESEPDQGDMRGKGALCKTIGWYADPKNYGEAGAARYAQLAKVYPDVFPPKLYEDKDQLLALMKAYHRHADHAFYEMKKHIPYRLSLDDLRQDARYYLGCLNMERGEHATAAKLLKPFMQAPTSDFAAPGVFVYARSQELMGGKNALKRAKEGYQWIISVHDQSGLKDDAMAGLERLANGGYGEDLTWVGDKVEAIGGPVARNYDVWVGENAIVVAPWIVSAKMRQYNMPNIWDESQRQLQAWTGSGTDQRVVVCAATSPRPGGKDTVAVDAWQIGDPPRWSLGLTDLAHNAVVARGSKALEGSPVFTAALAKFGATALQYQLVTETRDTIGSASAVKLPQEEVLNARKAAVAALEEYVREEPDPGRLNDEVVAGMLYQLLDTHGYGKHALIDWEPYSRFFEAVCRAESKYNCKDAKEMQALFVHGMNQAFGKDCGEQFATWGFKVDREQRVGALR